jgi:hypothetical protein
MPFVIGGNVAFRKFCREARGYPHSGGIAQTELGFGKSLNKRGRVAYLPTMEVRSSARRFKGGFFNFVFRYKLVDYLIKYACEELCSLYPSNFSKERG